MASSIKVGLTKINKKDKGFIIVQSDMPFIKSSDINKIYNSIKSKKYLVHVLKYRNRVGNPIGFDISIMKKFKKIKGDVGAKFMVKRLKKETKFVLKILSVIFSYFFKCNFTSFSENFAAAPGKPDTIFEVKFSFVSLLMPSNLFLASRLRPSE